MVRMHNIRKGGLRVLVYTTRSGQVGSGHDRSTHIIPSRRFGFLFTVLSHYYFSWAVGHFEIILRHCRNIVILQFLSLVLCLF
jgi:hypothetical protein